MASDVVMPRLSDSMEEGTVLKWLVEEGGQVKRGEALVEIETDKANMTYDADTDGMLVEVVAKEGDTLAVGEVIARIGEKQEQEQDQDQEQEEEQEPDRDQEPEQEQDQDQGQEQEQEPDRDQEPEQEQEPEQDQDQSESGSNGGAPERERAPAAAGGEEGSSDGERVKASPIARRMAREMGVELGQIEGSGPGGRIVKADVEGAAKDGGGAKEEPEGDERGKAEPAEKEAPPGERREAGAKGGSEVVELTRLQQTVSRRMAESKATAPDYSLVVEVDMTMAVELRKRLKDVTEQAPSFNDMVVKAAATALREQPRVNAAYRDGKFELYSRVNVGIAVAAQDALVVPTIFDADRKSLGQIARDARELSEKVRQGKVTPPEVSGGTFTVSNLGMYGIDEFTAVINPPQAAILTVGSLKKRAVVDDGGRIVARDTMKLSLVSDHRILYGAEAAEFLARVRELLEQPLALAL